MTDFTVRKPSRKVRESAKVIVLFNLIGKRV